MRTDATPRDFVVVQMQLISRWWEEKETTTTTTRLHTKKEEEDARKLLRLENSVWQLNGPLLTVLSVRSFVCGSVCVCGKPNRKLWTWTPYSLSMRAPVVFYIKYTHTHTTLASSWRESPVTRQTENNKKKRWGQLSQFQGGGGGGRKGGWCAVTVIWSRPLPHVFNCGNFKPPTSHTLTSLSNIVHTHAHTRDDIIQRRRWRKKKKMREKDK